MRDFPTLPETRVLRLLYLRSQLTVRVIAKIQDQSEERARQLLYGLKKRGLVEVFGKDPGQGGASIWVLTDLGTRFAGFAAEFGIAVESPDAQS